MSIAIENAESMEAFGEKIALLSAPGLILYLAGDLGVGKTTFVRGFLRSMGHNGKVKSPTYTLIEAYSFNEKTIYHFDLYRINDPEELEGMGIRDYFDNQSICLFEWPERGKDILPVPDIIIKLSYAGIGRTLTIEAKTDIGQKLLKQI